MSGSKFTDEFKRDAVAQVEDRGYPEQAIQCPLSWFAGKPLPGSGPRVPVHRL
jgi:transposase